MRELHQADVGVVHRVLSAGSGGSACRAKLRGVVWESRPRLVVRVVAVQLDHVDPPHRITTAELAEQLSPTLTRLGINRKILEALVGIQARRFWDVGFQPSDAATMAAELC